MPGDVVQSVLAPAGTEASAIHGLWVSMLSVVTVVFVAVLIGVGMAVLRGTRNRTAQRQTSSEPALARAVGGAVALSVVILVMLLTASVLTGRTLASLRASSAVTVEITGHQWWWEIQYEDSTPARRVVTANEIHIPAGRPIALKVTSRDVIHSFWVPNLQGKRDLIPGYTTAIWLQSNRRGTFRGQCAEFCGLQHAHMAIDVIAQSDEDFHGWLAAMRQPSRSPPGPVEREGHDVFMRSHCATCHTIRGTDAAGQVAPDLTHLASRSTLGAGTLANTPEHLAAWIRDPQRVKPGNQMPPTPLSHEDLQSLVAYLRTLR